MTSNNQPDQADFIRTVMLATYRHGEPLNEETDSILYESYTDHSHTAEAAGLAEGLTIGRVAVNTSMYGKCELTTRLSILHESAGMMPNEKYGRLLGALALDLRNTAPEHKKLPTIVQLDWSFYTKGNIILDLAEFDMKHARFSGMREMGQLLSEIKLEKLLDGLDDNGYATMYNQEMDAVQTRALTELITRTT